MSDSVCFFTGSQSLTGGTERACADTARNLCKHGFSVSILSQYQGRASHYIVGDSVSLEDFYSDRPRGLKGLFGTMWRLLKYVKKNRPKVLIAVESISFIHFLPLLFIRRRPVLINWEHFNATINLGIKSRDVARWLAVWFADNIVVISDRDAKLWQSRFGCPKSKLSRIYNVNPFDNRTGHQHQIKAYDIRNRIVLAVGRLTTQKGFDILIEAWEKIPEYSRNGWSVRICGEGPDRVSLQKLINERGLQDQVYLIGQVADIEQEYQCAQIFVLSSRFEGFGLVVLEALSFGLPVVSFDCPAGPSEIIEDGVDGLLIPPENTNELARALNSLIADDERRGEMAASAMRVRSQFSDETIALKWSGLLKKFWC